MARDFGARLVGFEFAGAADGGLYNTAAIGARIDTKRMPTMPSGLLRRSPLPKNKAKLANIATEPAIVAVTVMVKVS